MRVHTDHVAKLYSAPDPKEPKKSGDVDRFIDTMFSERQKDEHLAFAAVSISSHPSYPVTQTGFVEKYKKNQEIKAYISTATLHMGELDGEPRLLNRLEYFSGLHFVVLDDIGTKCPVESLPEVLKDPTTKVQTSKNNWQYGYKLATPIRDRQEAQDFVCNLYSSGPWDGGGAIATKYVRLPAGVHGKSTFKVKLDEIHPERIFTPQEMLNAAGFDPTSRPQRVKRTARQFATARERETVSMDGVVDPLLEIMNTAGMVVYDSGDWVNIICPWHQSHTDSTIPDNQTAGYRPVGRGGPEWELQRGFKCHHDHCSGRTTQEFLEYMSDKFRGELGRHPLELKDPLAVLVRDYAYCMSEDKVVDLRDAARCTPLAFTRAHQHTETEWKNHPLRQVAHLVDRRPDLNELLLRISTAGRYLTILIVPNGRKLPRLIWSCCNRGLSI